MSSTSRSSGPTPKSTPATGCERGLLAIPVRSGVLGPTPPDEAAPSRFLPALPPPHHIQAGLHVSQIEVLHERFQGSPAQLGMDADGKHKRRKMAMGQTPS